MAGTASPIDPFYAVDPVLIEKLVKLQKMGFDCASSSEISLVLNAGVTTDRIIYANTCKGTKYLKFAQKICVKRMAFDSETEAVKIANLHPQAELLIRISFKELNALFSFDSKFGESAMQGQRSFIKSIWCSLSHSKRAKELIQKAKKLKNSIEEKLRLSEERRESEVRLIFFKDRFINFTLNKKFLLFSTRMHLKNELK